MQLVERTQRERDLGVTQEKMLALDAAHVLLGGENEELGRQVAVLRGEVADLHAGLQIGK